MGVELPRLTGPRTVKVICFKHTAQMIFSLFTRSQNKRWSDGVKFVFYSEISFEVRQYVCARFPFKKPNFTSVGLQSTTKTHFEMDCGKGERSRIEILRASICRKALKRRFVAPQVLTPRKQRPDTHGRVVKRS